MIHSWWDCKDKLCVGDRGYYEADANGEYKVDQFGRPIPAK